MPLSHESKKEQSLTQCDWLGMEVADRTAQNQEKKRQKSRDYQLWGLSFDLQKL